MRRCDMFAINQKIAERDTVSSVSFNRRGTFIAQSNRRRRTRTVRKLANLKHLGSAKDYQCQFQSLLARTHNLKLRQQVDVCTDRLVDELRIDIEIQQPKNLGVAFNMAENP